MALLQCWPLVAISLLLSSGSSAAMLRAVALYNDTECLAAPFSMQVIASTPSCSEQSCSSIAFGDRTYYYNTTCVDDSVSVHALAATAFAGTKHIVMDQFSHDNCSDDSNAQTHVLQASNRCVPYAISSISQAGNASAVALVLDDGSVNIEFFNAAHCSKTPDSTVTTNRTQVAAHECYLSSKFYISTDVVSTVSASISSSNSDAVSTSSSGTSVTGESVVDGGDQRFSAATLIGSLSVAAVLILSVVVFVVWKWRSTKRKLLLARSTEPNDSIAMLEPEDMVYLSKPVSGRTILPLSSSTCSTFREQTTTRSFNPVLSSFGSSYQRSGRTFVPGSSSSSSYHRSGRTFIPGSSSSSTFQGTTANYPWEDDFVVAARIPRDKVVVVQLLSRGGFGVVYSGLYGGRRVAVKMLLPETRRHISHVVDLLAEVKMMASMEHPHIVEFIGVAWDSLTNMCVVSEFMAGGDLKALLSDYEEQEYPVGFSREKLKIALHIAYALTYMHSLDPPIIHRDLKSKNVLLNEKLDAKLTDFGTSRERVNESMTGGVGTCLWMAPEVMIGDKYDDKADLFSFGVVLSELDTHESPYWHAKDPTDSTRQMPQPAILQMVAIGKLHVKFSKEAAKTVVELANSCISLDPKARPTASEALYKLHTILADDVEKSGVAVE
ncbi:TKL protein kinase [Phytophthora cinnamomi]|uniref:TKL protein kinase n=1 Tax=Phytophthora cinnamomi TaxID=4785 RepID=UPI0035596AB4|nr:TKL protein kinase [Phytophthora cinnamomi]